MDGKTDYGLGELRPIQGSDNWRATVARSNVPHGVLLPSDAMVVDPLTGQIALSPTMMTTLASDTEECLTLIKGMVSANQQLINQIPTAVDQELDPVTSQIIQDIANLVGAIRTDLERTGGLSEQTFSVLNASTAAILNSITEETSGIDQAIADLNTGGGGTGPVELTAGSLESIRDGLATSEQADAIKQDTERAFKDGDTIQVDVVASGTDSEDSLTATHTRVGTQEPQVGN